jgi:RNA polymerase sigma-70 factor (ECF subfamily)
MENRTDEYYIREILKGDSGSFSFLVEKYQHMVYSLSMKILGNREEAEDSAQEAFLKAYNSLRFFNGRSSFKTWFFRIVYNNAISKKRLQKKYEYRIEDIHLSDSELAVTENAINKFQTEDRSKYLALGLDKLDPEERGLLNLYYYEEIPMDEIAVITGLSLSNTKVKIFRSRKHLLTELTKILKDETISIL